MAWNYAAIWETDAMLWQCNVAQTHCALLCQWLIDVADSRQKRLKSFNDIFLRSISLISLDDTRKMTEIWCDCAMMKIFEYFYDNRRVILQDLIELRVECRLILIIITLLAHLMICQSWKWMPATNLQRPAKWFIMRASNTHPESVCHLARRADASMLPIRTRAELLRMCRSAAFCSLSAFGD